MGTKLFAFLSVAGLIACGGCVHCDDQIHPDTSEGPVKMSDGILASKDGTQDKTSVQTVNVCTAPKPSRRAVSHVKRPDIGRKTLEYPHFNLPPVQKDIEDALKDLDEMEREERERRKSSN